MYAKTNVLIFADVFEIFRKLCQQYYEIGCAHLSAAPSLCWQTSLKMSETSLELLTDIDMPFMIENGIRDEISMIRRRYAKANFLNTTHYNSNEPPI